MADIAPLVVFLDATYLPTRPSGAKEGVLVAWGYDLEGLCREATMHAIRSFLDQAQGQRRAPPLQGPTS